jgi:hypothetical protein
LEGIFLISNSGADAVLVASLLVSLGAYVFVSKREGSYLNILTPTFLIGIPAYYLLPLATTHLFGNDATPYAYTYVYATLAAEHVAFAYTYTRSPRTLLRLPFRFSYNNFGSLSFAFLAIALLIYVPILLQFREYIFDPRQIYEHTRVGFGVNYYVSSTFAYLSVILIQFSNYSKSIRWSVVLVCIALLSLHGSKGQVLSLFLVLALFEVYVHGRQVRLLPSLIVAGCLSVLVLLLFIASMAIEKNPMEAVETISEYSDYTRNAMLVIDSHFPPQYGRLTLEGHLYGRIPRFLMPDKPTNFGALYLDDQFFSKSIDDEKGAPDFGIGLQYADFGIFAIVYLAIFGAIRGWLARVFVHRLNGSKHPADFFMVAFLANIPLFAVGAVGWLLPEAFLVAFLLRFASQVGAEAVYRDRIRLWRQPTSGGAAPINGFGGHLA